jgi:hypothetical protein
VIFDHLLTIHLKYGDKIVLGVKQDGMAITFKIEGYEIVFNAFPGGGDILVKKQFVVGENEIEGKLIGEVFPNPTAGTLNINLINIDHSVVMIFNNVGMIVKRIELKSSIDVLNINELSAGNYYLEVVSLKNNSRARVQFVKR